MRWNLSSVSNIYEENKSSDSRRPHIISLVFLERWTARNASEWKSQITIEMRKIRV